MRMSSAHVDYDLGTPGLARVEDVREDRRARLACRAEESQQHRTVRLFQVRRKQKSIIRITWRSHVWKAPQLLKITLNFEHAPKKNTNAYFYLNNYLSPVVTTFSTAKKQNVI